MNDASWTIARLLDFTADYLAKAAVESPRLCAELLLAHVLNCQRIELYTRFDHCPAQPQRDAFKALFKRCAQQEPVAYLTGTAHFYSLEFNVTPDVLIPRPETEQLVMFAIDHLRAQPSDAIPRVLDIGTGSGCIPIAVARNHDQTDLTAMDISPAALNVARTNCDRHQCADRITLLESDCFSALNPSDRRFDLILSNPPYISEAEMPGLPENVRSYEPRLALTAGPDGLNIIRRILCEAPDFIKPEGRLIMEIAEHQGNSVKSLLEKDQRYDQIEVLKDQFNQDRFVNSRLKRLK